MAIKQIANGMLNKSAFFNKRFLQRPLKAHEKISIDIGNTYKSISKFISNDYGEVIGEKCAYKEAKKSLISNEIITDTYVGKCQKWSDNKMFFDRTFKKNKKTYKVAQEYKDTKKHIFSEAKMKNNIMTEYIQERNLKTGKTDERTVIKYYNNSGDIVQTELYDKDNKFVQKNICTKGRSSDKYVIGEKMSFIKINNKGESSIVENASAFDFDFNSHIEISCFG